MCDAPKSTNSTVKVSAALVLTAEMAQFYTLLLYKCRTSTATAVHGRPTVDYLLRGRDVPVGTAAAPAGAGAEPNSKFQIFVRTVEIGNSPELEKFAASL